MRAIAITAHGKPEVLQRRGYWCFTTARAESGWCHRQMAMGMRLQRQASTWVTLFAP